MSEGCGACRLAEINPRTGHYRADCLECSARALAQSPQHFDSQRANAILPAYRDALQAVFGADWKDGHKRVKAWVERFARKL